MGQKPQTPKEILHDLLTDYSLWLLIISHLSVIGLVWYDGWHPLTLVWIYLTQQLVQFVLDIFWLLYNPLLDVSGLKINGKQATDSKTDRKDSSGGVFIAILSLGGIMVFFILNGMGPRVGTLPLILSSTGIFAFQKLFSYYYIRLIDGAPKMNMGCMAITPIITIIFLTGLFFLGNFIYMIFDSTNAINNHLSIGNLIFLILFIILKLLFDALTYIVQNYGSSTEGISSKP